MQEGDIILCKVEKVTNTVTIVRLPNGKEGTIISSEISPGRIKHMRHFVIPNKTIVCKVLKILGENTHLSLRRVSSKEKKEALQRHKQGTAIELAFKQILKNDFEKISKKILEEYPSLFDFAYEAKENKDLLEKFIPKGNQEAAKKIIQKKGKSHELKQNIKIKCLGDDGIKRIKKVLEVKDQNSSISYVSAGNFKLRLKVEDYKVGKKKLNEILEEIAKKAKENDCEFSSTEEK